MFDLQKYQLRARTNLHNLFVSIRSGFMIVSKKAVNAVFCFVPRRLCCLMGIFYYLLAHMEFSAPIYHSFFPLCSLL